MEGLQAPQPSGSSGPGGSFSTPRLPHNVLGCDHNSAALNFERIPRCFRLARFFPEQGRWYVGEKRFTWTDDKSKQSFTTFRFNDGMEGDESIAAYVLDSESCLLKANIEGWCSTFNTLDESCLGQFDLVGVCNANLAGALLRLHQLNGVKIQQLLKDVRLRILNATAQGQNSIASRVANAMSSLLQVRSIGARDRRTHSNIERHCRYVGLLGALLILCSYCCSANTMTFDSVWNFDKDNVIEHAEIYRPGKGRPMHVQAQDSSTVVTHFSFASYVFSTVTELLFSKPTIHTIRRSDRKRSGPLVLG